MYIKKKGKLSRESMVLTAVICSALLLGILLLKNMGVLEYVIREHRSRMVYAFSSGRKQEGVTIMKVTGPIDFEEDLRYMASSDFYTNIQSNMLDEEAMFHSTGRPNLQVVDKLLEFVDSTELHEGQGFEYSNTEDFSNAGIYTDTQDEINNILIRLIPIIKDRTGLQNGYSSEFSTNWWVPVYRTKTEDDDVLTLMMRQPYRLSSFSGDRYMQLVDRYDETTFKLNVKDDLGEWSDLELNRDNTLPSDYNMSEGYPPSYKYFNENNYSNSIVRDNLLRDFSFVLGSVNISKYIVKPSNLPVLWQSSDYQTGTDKYDNYYKTNLLLVQDGVTSQINKTLGLGATGLIWDTEESEFNRFMLNNGLDGKSVGPVDGGWVHTMPADTYNDIIWIPSDYETRTEGFKKNKYKIYSYVDDTDNNMSNLKDYNNQKIIDIENGRSGMWGLTGYDRSFDTFNIDPMTDVDSRAVWLRSSPSTSIGNASVISNSGSILDYGTSDLGGVRPAIHISLKELRKSVEYGS